MDKGVIELTHNEISLLVFALERGNAATVPDASRCEDACPVVQSVEQLLCGGTLDSKQQLIRHLNNHLREALIECGMFELMAAANTDAPMVSVEHRARLQQVNARLSKWSCEMNLNEAERCLLYESLSRLPLSSWITMPRTMWRLKKQLKAK